MCYFAGLSAERAGDHRLALEWYRRAEREWSNNPLYELRIIQNQLMLSRRSKSDSTADGQKLADEIGSVEQIGLKLKALYENRNKEDFQAARVNWPYFRREVIYWYVSYLLNEGNDWSTAANVIQSVEGPVISATELLRVRILLRSSQATAEKLRVLAEVSQLCRGEYNAETNPRTKFEMAARLARLFGWQKLLATSAEAVRATERFTEYRHAAHKLLEDSFRESDYVFSPLSAKYLTVRAMYNELASKLSDDGLRGDLLQSSAVVAAE